MVLVAWSCVPVVVSVAAVRDAEGGQPRSGAVASARSAHAQATSSASSTARTRSSSPPTTSTSALPHGQSTTSPSDRERGPAGAAPRPARRLVDLQPSTFDRRALGHQVEAEPDGLRHDPGDLADPQVHGRDRGTVGPLDDHLDDALGDRELVHGRLLELQRSQCGADHLTGEPAVYRREPSTWWAVLRSPTTRRATSTSRRLRLRA